VNVALPDIKRALHAELLRPAGVVTLSHDPGGVLLTAGSVADMLDAAVLYLIGTGGCYRRLGACGFAHLTDACRYPAPCRVSAGRDNVRGLAVVWPMPYAAGTARKRLGGMGRTVTAWPVSPRPEDPRRAADLGACPGGGDY